MASASAVAGEPAKLTPKERAALSKKVDNASKLYSQQEYQEALDAFQSAYQLSNEPLLLFNIAQCYRMLGKKQEALDTYKASLPHAPDAESKATIESLISSLESELSPALDVVPASAPGKEPTQSKRFRYLAPLPFLGVTAVAGAGAFIVEAKINKEIESSQVFRQSLDERRIKLAVTADVSLLFAGVSSLVILTHNQIVGRRAHE